MTKTLYVKFIMAIITLQVNPYIPATINQTTGACDTVDIVPQTVDQL